MGDDTGAKAPRRQGVGSFAPHVPYLNTGDKPTVGRRGRWSRRRRARTLQLAETPTPMRDWRLAVGGALAARALGQLVVAGPRRQRTASPC